MRNLLLGPRECINGKKESDPVQWLTERRDDDDDYDKEGIKVANLLRIRMF